VAKGLPRPNRRQLIRYLSVAGALGFALVAYVFVTLPDVRPLRTQNPTTTAFMKLREQESKQEGRRLRHVHRWVPYARISPHLKRAVLVAEDAAFFQHGGLDFQQIRRTIEEDLPRGRNVRGASTITQQLAKNLYLSPSRNPVRKLTELLITRRLEAELSKVRIFEIYLNVIEWGDGVWGAEAAARTYFGTSAAALSREQAALLAAAIINPRVLTPARPGARLLRRRALILSRMGGVDLAPSQPAVPTSPPSEAGDPSEEPKEDAPADDPNAPAGDAPLDELTSPDSERPTIAQ
jgi:monofunctional biosynthetic peptidoglycan transglycosylase